MAHYLDFCLVFISLLLVEFLNRYRPARYGFDRAGLAPAGIQQEVSPAHPGSPSSALSQRDQPLRYLHDCSDCFRLEQHRRVGFAPTEKHRLCTAHATFSHSRCGCVCLECSRTGRSCTAISTCNFGNLHTFKNVF